MHSLEEGEEPGQDAGQPPPPQRLRRGLQLTHRRRGHPDAPPWPARRCPQPDGPDRPGPRRGMAAGSAGAAGVTAGAPRDGGDATRTLKKRDLKIT